MKSRFALRFLLITLVFIAGFAANSIIRSLSSEPNRGRYVEPREQQQEVARLANIVAKLQTANAKLENELARMEKSPSEVAELTAQRHGTKQAIRLSEEGGFSIERFLEMMTRQVKQQLDVVATRLELIDFQRAKLEEIMLMRMMQMPTRFGPNGSQPSSDTDTPMITQQDIDDLAAEILDPDQIREYDEMKAQEDASRSEMMATAQLSQIAPKLGLSENQKDEVFAIYYDQAMGMNSGMMEPKAMEEARARADEQIFDILDNKQREVFETLRENSSFGNFTIYAR